MWRIFAFTSLIALFADAREILGRVSEKDIIGGRDTDITEVPYMVNLLVYNTLHCGGSILNENHILTAAHCLLDYKPVDAQIRVGSSYTNKDGTLHHIVAAYPHKKFSLRPIIDYDVAVLRIDPPIKFNERAQPVKLANAPPPAGTNATIAGWGTINNTTIVLPHKLQSTTIKIFDFYVCQGYYSDVTSRMICAQTTGRASCYGDSGGAMTVNGTAVGIVSYGNGCAQDGIPGVYTSVGNAEILSFIKEKMKA